MLQGAQATGWLSDIRRGWVGVGNLGVSNVAALQLLIQFMGYGSYSAAAGRSDGYKQGSAFFVMTPFRHNVFVGV